MTDQEENTAKAGPVKLTFHEWFRVGGRGSAKDFQGALAIFAGGLLAVGYLIYNPDAFLFGLVMHDAVPLWACCVGALNVLTSTVLVCAAVRRLHDIDQTGWFAVLTFAPFVNLGFMLFLAFVPGNSDENVYGAVPPEAVAYW